MTPAPGPTRVVVASAIGLSLLAFAYYVLGPWAAGLVLLVMLYEGWTLVNRYPNDTISEIMWELAARPMVPFVFGILSGWALGHGAVVNAYAIAAWFFLMGHFFFQKYEPSAVPLPAIMSAIAATGEVSMATSERIEDAVRPLVGRTRFRHGDREEAT